MSNGVSRISPGYAIARWKHGRRRILAKVVVARPAGEVVVAMPTKNRRFATPSLPLEALELARQAGATAWVVRFDDRRQCYRLPLELAEQVGYVGHDGELYVPMAFFRRSEWVEWDYTEEAIEV